MNFSEPSLYRRMKEAASASQRFTGDGHRSEKCQTHRPWRNGNNAAAVGDESAGRTGSDPYSAGCEHVEKHFGGCGGTRRGYPGGAQESWLRQRKRTSFQSHRSQLPARQERQVVSQPVGGLTHYGEQESGFVIRADGSVLAAKNNSGFWSGDPAKRYFEAWGYGCGAGDRTSHRHQKLANAVPGGTVGGIGSLGSCLHTSLIATFLFRVRVQTPWVLLRSVVLLACASAAAAHAQPQQPDAADQPAAAQSAKKSQNKQTDADATGEYHNGGHRSGA